MNYFKRWMAMSVIASTMGASAAAHAQAGSVPAGDAKKIHAVLDGMAEAWNQHDMKAFVSYMTDDVEWVNVVGMWWKGKAQVYQAHEAFHQTIFKNRNLHPAEKVELRSVSPNTMIVTSITPSDGFTTPSGHVEPPSRNLLTLVFVRHSDGWFIVEGHNTTIVEEAQKSNPVK